MTDRSSELPNQSVTRREFLKVSATYLAALGLTSIVPAAVVMSDLTYPGKYLGEVKLNNSRKVKLVLGVHSGPDATKINREDFSHPMAGIFIDSSDNWLTSGFPEKLNNAISQGMDWAETNSPFYYEALRFVTDEHIPLLYGDSPLSDPDIVTADSEEIRNHVVAVLSSSLAGLGLTVEAHNLLSRRAFLKWSARLVALGGVASSLYFSSDSLLAAAVRLGAVPNTDSERNLAAILSDLIHPNNYIIVMRNIIWALKINDFYDQGLFTNDQIVNVLGGWNHRFVGFFSQHSEIAKRYFETFKYKELVNKYWPGDSKEWFHKSLIYRYKGNSQYVEHPNLKSLIE